MTKKTQRPETPQSGEAPIKAKSPRAGSKQPARPSSSTSMVVGIGASAGGLEAFKAFFSHMPEDSEFAFVLVQHLSASHVSMLSELLGHSTRMPVVEARDGTRVESRHVYVIPPNATLTLSKGVLRVDKPAPPRAQRWPINSFFTSLAEDLGDRAVCIVLSGLGSDGAQGLRAIKDHGGLTLAQSGFDHVAMSGMPASAASTGLVDDILPVEDMPARLLTYWDQVQALKNGQDGDDAPEDLASHLQTLFRLVRDEVGHDFSRYKQSTLLRRLQRRMLVCQATTLSDYIEFLRKHPEENHRLLQELLISVTEFFRDTAAFHVLKEQAIPAVLANKSAVDVIRVWVPGCATGEEAYSIAILFAEAIGEFHNPRVQIFATDIDEHAIDSARAGRFRMPLEGVSAARLDRWFRKEGDDYCVIKKVREMCVFSPHSVIKDPPFSKLDLISCRNLLIYLNADLQDHVFLTFSYALKPGGFLFIGPSESLGRHTAQFDEVDKKQRLYRRRPPNPAEPGLAFPLAGPGPAVGASQGNPVSVRSASEVIDRNIRRLLEKYSPVYVLLSSKHDVLRFAGDTGRYLSPSTGAASLNIFGLLHKRLREPARAIVRQAFAKGIPVTREALTIEIHDQPRMVKLIAEPLVDNDGDVAMCVLAFSETPPDVPSVGSGPFAESAGETSRVLALEHELELAHIQLHTAIELHETASEDLKSANEEYQSVNQELQSVNEELETSKEEMQSINEELQVVNMELQGKNDALTHLNNDLINLMDSTEVATLFLDGQMRIGSYTPASKNLFHLRDGDRGRPISDIASKISYSDLAKDFKKVHQNRNVVERSLTSIDEKFIFLMRMRPYRTAEGTIDGVVLTFFDVTESKRTEAQREALAAIVDSSRDAVIGYALDDTIISWNQGAERILGHNAAWAIGKPLSVLLAANASEETRLAFSVGVNQQRSDQFESIWTLRSGNDIAMEVTNSPVRDQNNCVISGALVARDISERRRVEEHQKLLLGELNHRVKNTLANIQAIAVQSLADSPNMREFQKTFLDRLHSLSQTHNLLSAEAWTGVSLSTLVSNEAMPFKGSDNTQRVQWKGDDLRLTPRSALTLGMTLHELTTNAVKYGALSVKEGRVEVQWEVRDVEESARLFLTWQESGGPPVSKPTRRGFGTRLITGGVAFELNGNVSLEFLPSGLRCEIDLPMNECSDTHA